MEGRQLSTALSDFFLALSAYFAAVWLRSENSMAAFGISFQGLAAVIGIARFSFDTPDDGIVKAHQAFCRLTTFIGIPMICIGFCSHFEATILRGIVSVLSLIAISFSYFMEPEVRGSIGEAVAGLAITNIIALCLYYGNMTGFLACMIYILSAMIIGTEGAWFGIPRIDLLHYALIFGNIAFAKALS